MRTQLKWRSLDSNRVRPSSQTVSTEAVSTPVDMSSFRHLSWPSLCGQAVSNSHNHCPDLQPPALPALRLYCPHRYGEQSRTE
jgi:hypothetical protein